MTILSTFLHAGDFTHNWQQHGLQVVEQFSGRLHPLLVHFPVGLLMLAAIIEFLRLWRSTPKASETIFACLGFGMLFAWCAVGSGWLNADIEGFNANKVFWHRWLGVATASLSTVAFVVALFHRKRSALRKPLAALIFVTAGTLAVGGHLGGEITRHQGYLFEVLTFDGRPHTDGSDPVVADENISSTDEDALPGAADWTAEERYFVTDVRPILTRCIECHGPKKTKGHLRLDTKELAFKPPRPGRTPRIIAGKSQESELYELISLPPDDPDIMPSKGDPLTPEQIATIRKWIDDGAQWPDGVTIDGAPKLKVITKPDEAKQTRSDTDTDTSKTATATADDADHSYADRDAAKSEAERAEASQHQAIIVALGALSKRGVYAAPIARDVEQYEVNFSLLGAAISDSDLAPLEAFGATLVAVNLSRTGITADGLAHLAGATHLERLDLSRTSLDDAALASVASFHDLVYLNLYGTKVSDAGMPSLVPLKKLRKLFLWQSAVTETGAEELRSARPELTVNLGASPLPSAKKDDGAPATKDAKKPGAGDAKPPKSA